MYGTQCLTYPFGTLKTERLWDPSQPATIRQYPTMFKGSYCPSKGLEYQMAEHVVVGSSLNAVSPFSPATRSV